MLRFCPPTQSSNRYQVAFFWLLGATVITALFRLIPIFISRDPENPMARIGITIDFVSQGLGIATIFVGLCLAKQLRLTKTTLSFGLGLIFWFVGDLLFKYAEHVSLGKMPIADVFFLAGYPFMLAGLILWPSVRDKSIARASAWLDGVVVFVILAGLVLRYAIFPAFQLEPGKEWEVLVNSAYPAMDLFLIAGLIAVLGRRFERRHVRPTATLVGAMVLNLYADIVYTTSFTTGDANTDWLRIPFLLSRTLIVIAAADLWWQTSKASDGETFDPSELFFWGSSLLCLVMIGQTANLLLRNLTNPADLAMVFAAGLGLLLILVRQLVILRENTHLMRQYREQLLVAKQYGENEEAHRVELEALTQQLKINNDQLKLQLHQDLLTGLENHRMFQHQLDEAIDRFQAARVGFSLILVDIDFFREYNLRKGHAAGDETLVRTAQLLSTICPQANIFRFSGKQFALLYPGATEREAYLVAAKICSGFAEEFSASHNLTVSVGVYEYDDASVSHAEAEYRLDRALYQAKTMGRNRVAQFSELPPEIQPSQTSDSDKVVSLTEDFTEVINFALMIGRQGRDPDPADSQALNALVCSLELRDVETEMHTQRVMWFALHLCCELHSQGMHEIHLDDLRQVAIGALLHDIGKIGVPDAVLRKPGKLSSSEYDIIKRHAAYGSTLLKRFPNLMTGHSVVRHHHERWDGRGYPDQLTAEDIPFAARVFMFADTLDAMASKRPYKEPMTHGEICAEVMRMAGDQFDPLMAAVFVNIDELEWERIRLGDTYDLRDRVMDVAQELIGRPAA